jgi:protein-S-isoprenylcysteine O-methyltransferase Ste14
MHNPESNGADGRSSEPLCQSASGLEHWLTGLIGLTVTFVVAVAVYSTVAAMAEPLQYLSSTAVIFLFVGLWIALWGALEIAWEWRAGRLFAG